MILIVGGGFLGSYLARHIKAVSDEKILVTVRNDTRGKYLSGSEHILCDVSVQKDLESLAEKCGNEPLDIFYLAACHNVDYVFENPEKAKKINIDALAAVLETLPNIRRLIFASTDCVYGEDGGASLTETSELRPVNEYGRQKAVSEKLVLKNGFTCARLPFMIGKSIIEKPHFYDKLLNNLKAGKEFEMLNGMVRSVLSFEDVAEILFKLIKSENELPSVINIAGDKAYSKYDVGCTIARKNGFNCALIKKLSVKDGCKFFKEKRASSSVMDNSLLKAVLNIEKISWEEDIC